MPMIFFNRSPLTKLIEEAAIQMARSGYRHNDLKYQHVGTYLLGKGQRVAFMDLTDVSIVDEHDSTAVSAAATQMIADIKASL